MNSTSSDKAVQAEGLCSYPRCGEERFAQNKVCLAHYRKLSWVLDKSWYDVTRWARWAGVVVVAGILLLLFV